MSRKPKPASATARDAFAAVQRNPVGFCEQELGAHLWSKQRQILESVRDNRRTAVRSCHGVGKTYTAAMAVLWFLAAHPGSCRVVTTAPTWLQVRDLLWREIHAAASRAGRIDFGALTTAKLEIDSSWFAIGLSTNEPERFQGHHAEHLLLVVDEASGVDEPIFEAAEGFLTGDHARVLLIGNPTQLAGQFHRAFHAERALWSSLHMSVFDSPVYTGETVPDHVLRALVTKDWVEEKRVKWGTDSPMWQVRVLGDFPSTADDTVCSLADVEAAQARTMDEGQPTVIACDPARFGSDETVIVKRRGDRVRILESYHGQDTTTTAGKILRHARDDFADKPEGRGAVLVVDEIGIGAGIVDMLRQDKRFRVVAFNAAHTAKAPADYPNRRSEAWFDFADEHLPRIDMDGDEQLAADLVAPKYTIDSQGRRVVEPKDKTKERLGRSPDRADAVLMAFVPEARHSPPERRQAEREPGIMAGIVDRQF